MNPRSAPESTRRPTSVKQRIVSAGLAAGMFFGVGGLIAVKAADAASTVAAGSSTATTSTSTPTSNSVVHATTSASKG